MQRIITVVLAALILGALATPASAQFTQFSEDVATNGAHLYARTHGMGAPTIKTDVDCLAVRAGTNHRSALWLCAIDTFDAIPAPGGIGTVDKPRAHAIVSVARRDGRYVLRRTSLAL